MTQLEDARREVISYARLYRLWETNSWSATELDFERDKTDWHERLTDLQRDAALWNYAMFLVGEEAVARTLTPLIDAAPEYEQKIFLTTQTVDESRHHVFFDRFVREVCDLGRDTRTTLDAVDGHLTWGFRQVFAELDRVTEELRRKPKDRPLLAQAVALYHIVVEGMLALAGQHFIQRYIDRLGILPGFSAGIANVSRDESRHVAFGVKFLGELVQESKECRAAAIELWDRVLPWAAGVFVPPNRNRAYAECFDFTLEEIYAFGLRSFETKLRRIGIDPQEVALIARQDPTLSYEEKAEELWSLIDDGVLGDDRRTPEVGERSLEILVRGAARGVDPAIGRKLGGPVQLDLGDSVWHISFAPDGSARPVRGPAADAAAVISVSPADWALVAVGRLDRRRAVLTRRMRLQGPVRTRIALDRLFALN